MIVNLEMVLQLVYGLKSFSQKVKKREDDPLHLGLVYTADFLVGTKALMSKTTSHAYKTDASRLNQVCKFCISDIQIFMG